VRTVPRTVTALMVGHVPGGSGVAFLHHALGLCAYAGVGFSGAVVGRRHLM
jgi:hypothetical protein